MTDFIAHTSETAPEDSKEALAGVQKAFGFVPNLLGVMAESPAMLAGYLTMGNLFGESSFSPLEQQLVLITVSQTNGCGYCVAAHSGMATAAAMPDDVLEAIRGNTEIADPRLEALRIFTKAVVDDRGWVGQEKVEAFLSAGFTKAQVLEVVLGVGMKTMSNYTNHMAETLLDSAFESHRIDLRKAS